MIRFTSIFAFLLILILVTGNGYSQELKEIKKQAEEHMEKGRYGEAIDLLNKFISANPREEDGYHLRGLSFEKRNQLEPAVIDLRRANKLNPNRNTIKKDLGRVLEKWHNYLRDKITGHLREIAIDPEDPTNYLEIGKSYKKLEEWINAEKWYDKYLARDKDASPDEIIRYTEILAKNKHIVKGERILKEWVDRYPEDWRLLSKYGYFALWIGKRRAAKKSFEKALEFKPYFKEAQEGLEKANRKAYVTDIDPEPARKEFPIDRYYRLLRKDPSKAEYRYKLIDELVKNNRLEEAFQQLQILSETEAGKPEFEKLWTDVTSYRNNFYDEKLKRNLAKYEQKGDTKALNNVLQFYEYLQQYDKAITLLEEYFNENPESKNKELLFKYSKLAAYQKNYDLANEKIDILLNEYPNNLDYKLFKGQILVWNKQDLDLAEEYLLQVLDKRPNNVEVVVALGSLYLARENLDLAEEYLFKAKELAPKQTNVFQLQSNVEFFKEVLKEREIYAELEKARSFFLDGDCETAIEYYESYMEKTQPNTIVLKEYGDAHFCAENYYRSIEIYESILENENNTDVKIQKAKVYYIMGDSLNAVNEFKQIVEENPDDFNANLYLADSYVKLGEYDEANSVYDSLLTWELDSTEVVMIEQRKKWIPASGLLGIIENFPTYAGVQPTSSFYSDNISFKILKAGGRLEMGLLPSLSLGVAFIKSYIDGTFQQRDRTKIPMDTEFTLFKGSLFWRINEKLNASVGLGNLAQKDGSRKEVFDAAISYELSDEFNAKFTYNRSDAALLLYSPYLVTQRYEAEIYRIDGEYIAPHEIILSGTYQYFTVTDDNKGNDLKFRVGKAILSDLKVGYEYYFANWRFDSKYYYSPINGFESHSAWATWNVEKADYYSVFLGGRLGWVPASDYIIREVFCEGKYHLTDDISIDGKLSLGSTYRFDDSYTYVSGMLSAYIAL